MLVPHRLRRRPPSVLIMPVTRSHPLRARPSPLVARSDPHGARFASLGVPARLVLTDSPSQSSLQGRTRQFTGPSPSRSSPHTLILRLVLRYPSGLPLHIPGCRPPPTQRCAARLRCVTPVLLLPSAHHCLGSPHRSYRQLLYSSQSFPHRHACRCAISSRSPRSRAGRSDRIHNTYRVALHPRSNPRNSRLATSAAKEPSSSSIHSPSSCRRPLPRPRRRCYLG